jgi:glutamyl-tRNA synthetase
MTMDELVQAFSLDRVLKNNPKFDRAKLLAFNTQAVEAATPQRLLEAFKDFLAANPESPLNEAGDAALAQVLSMRKGFRLFRDVEETSRFLFVPDDRIEYQPEAVDKVLKKNDALGLNVLRDLRPILAGVANWTAHDLEAAVNHYGEQNGLGLGKIAQPLRVAVSGGTVSPPIFESLEMLGRDRTLTRIARCVAAAA